MFGSQLRRWRDAIALPPIDPAGLASARHVTNARRVLTLARVLAVMHVGSLVFYGWFVSRTSPAHARWAAHLTAIHAVYAVVALGLAAWCARRRRFAGEAFAALYVGYGAIVSANTHLIRTNVEVFVAAVIVVAVFVPIATKTAAGIFAAGTAALIAGVQLASTDATAWASTVGNAAPTALVALAISRFQLAAFARDAGHRQLIARQQVALEATNRRLADANHELARSVERQSSEIRSVAQEARELDRQLRARLRDRAQAWRRAIAAGEPGLTADELASGAVLVDRFVVGAVLGRGGMGVVVRCHDRWLGRDVALKTLVAPRDPAALARFMTEVEAMAAVRHPAIVRPLHLDVTDDGRAFAVQDLVEGTSLERWRTQRRTLPLAHIARLGATLADALATAHREDVFHLDVKPSNIMLTTAPPGLKLVDFGIAWLRSAPEVARSRAGTAGYMAPEQRAAGATITDRADVFAVGVTLAVLATGSPPGDAVRALDREPDCAALAAIVARCVAPEARDRPPARELAAALDDLARRAGAAALDELHRRAIADAGAATAPEHDPPPDGSTAGARPVPPRATWAASDA